MRTLLLGLMIVALAFSAAADEPDNPGDEPPPVEDKAAIGNLLMAFENGGHVGPIHGLYFTANGKKLISVGEDRTVQVWNVETGQRLRVWRLPADPTSGLDRHSRSQALAPDGRTLLVGSSGFRPEPNKPAINGMVLLNLEDGRILPLLGPAGSGTPGVVFSADGDRAIGIQGETCWVWDGLKNIWDREHDPAGVKTRTNFGSGKGRVKMASLTADGTRLASVLPDHKGFRIWDLSSPEKPVQVAEHADNDGSLCALSWSPDGKRLATGHGHSKREKGAQNEVRIWSPDGKLVKSYPAEDVVQGRKSYRLHRLFFRGDNEVLLLGNKASQRLVLALNLQSGAVREVVRLPDYHGLVQTAGFSADGQLGAIGPGPGNRIALFKLQDKGAPTLRWLGHGHPLLEQVGWHPKGHVIAWNSKSGGPLDRALDLKELHVLDRFPAEPFVQAIHNRNGLELISIHRGTRHAEVKRGGKQVAQTEPTGIIHALTFPAQGKPSWFAVSASSGLKLFDTGSGKLLDHFKDAPSQHVAPSPDGKYLLSAYDAHSLRIYSSEKRQLLLRLFVAGSEWVAWLPKEGYYAASPGGEKLMGWSVNNGPNQAATCHPASRFRKQMYRPDVISKVLELGSVEEALKAANVARQDLEQILPPGVTLHHKQEGARVDVEVTARPGSKGQPLTELQLLVDGRPARLENGQLAGRSFAMPQEKETRESWRVKLEPGAHQLSVRATSKDAYSISSEVSVEVKAPPSVPPASKRGTLHYVGIGVNQFKDEPELKLTGAVPDVQNMEKCLRQQCKDHYNVQTTPLIDKEATLAAILKTLVELQKKLKPTDVVIVHYSSHGEVEPDGGLFLLCHDSKRDKLKETALPGQQLRDILGQYPCPVLLILDACHSGKFPLMRPPTDPLSRLLADDSCGVAVMTAALAHQKAVDTEKGGVFTQGLIEGLSGGAKPSGDGKRLYAHQLYTFVFDFVTGKTDFKQMPLYLPSGSVPHIVLKDQ